MRNVSEEAEMPRRMNWDAAVGVWDDRNAAHRPD